MYCQKCGNQIDEDSQYCHRCGSIINNESTNSFIPPPPQYVIPTIKKPKRIFFIILITIFLIIVIPFYYSMTISDLEVDDVKDGILYDYEYETIGGAFEDYFNKCSWESFVDTDQMLDVVEFTGYYSNEQKFVMRFVHDNNDDNLDEDEFIIWSSYLDGEMLTESEQNSFLYCIYNDYEWDPDTDYDEYNNCDNSYNDSTI